MTTDRILVIRDSFRHTVIGNGQDIYVETDADGISLRLGQTDWTVELSYDDLMAILSYITETEGWTATEMATLIQSMDVAAVKEFLLENGWLNDEQTSDQVSQTGVGKLGVGES